MKTSGRPSTLHRPPLTTDQAAEYLNVAPRFIRRLVAERRISFIKLGKFVRFDPEVLDRLIEDGRVEPHSAPAWPRREAGPRSGRKQQWPP